MIAKISHGCNVVSLIEYHEQKIKKGTATLLSTKHFLRPNKQLYKAVFEEYITNSRMDNPTFHASINLPPGERVNQETFKSLANDYMEGLGYGNQPYVVYHHHDRQHDHIHIISVNVQENGQRIETYYQHNKSQDLTRELETKYNLTVVSNQKSTLREEVDTTDLKTKSGIKSFIARTNRDVLQNYHPTTFVEYKKILALHNVKVEQTTNPDTEVKGYFFQVNDQPNTVKVMGSDLYYRFNDNILERNFTKNSTIKTNYNSKSLSDTIYKSLRSFEQINFADFESIMKEQNISVIYDRYKNNNIYGISFVDHKSGVILKGTEINRNYSFGKLKEIVNEGDTKKKLNSILYEAYYAGYSEYRESNFNVDQLKFIDLGDPVSKMQKWIGENYPDRGKEVTDAVLNGFIADREIAVKKNLEKLQKLKALNSALEKHFKDFYTKSLRSGEVKNKREYIENFLDGHIADIKEKVLSEPTVSPILPHFDVKTIDKQFELFQERKHKDRFRIDFQDSLHTLTKAVINHICPKNNEDANRDVFLALTNKEEGSSIELLRESCFMAIRAFSDSEKDDNYLNQNEKDRIIKKQSLFVSDMIVKKYAQASLADEITKVIKEGFNEYKKSHKKQSPSDKARYSSYLEQISSNPGELIPLISESPDVKSLNLEEHLKNDLKKTIEISLRAKTKVVPLIRMQEDLSDALREEAKTMSESEKLQISEIFSEPVYIDVLSQTMLDRARKHDDYGMAARNFGEESIDRSLRTFLIKNIEGMANWYKEYVPFVDYRNKQNVFSNLLDQVLTELGESRGNRTGLNTARNDRKRRNHKL